MPLKRRWKIALFSAFLTVSLSLLFIPYQEVHDLGYNDPYGGIALPEGEDFVAWIIIPWRSFSQKFTVYFNLSEGMVTMEILDRDNYHNYNYGGPYVAYKQYINITIFDDIIPIEPPFQRPIYLVVIAEEDTTFKPQIKFEHLLYHSSYGFFFVGITSILLIYYAIQFQHKKFNFQ